MAASGIAADARAAGVPPGFRVPAEEDQHEATPMMWPSSRKVYRDRVFLEMTRAVIAEIANTISAFEPVILLADKAQHEGARRHLSDRVVLWDVPTEDLWARDAGPLIARSAGGKRAVSHIRFNGWGRRQSHANDGQVARRVADRLGLPLYDSGLVGEAGGVEQDGHGLLIAHASSWETASRNPGLDRGRIGELLLKAYGAHRIVWGDGVRGKDITDYHIDSLARFTGPGHVLINLPRNPDPRDPFHVAALRTQTALEDAGLAITTILEPNRPRVKSPEFVASYANFYVCNGAVLAARFGDSETDAHAVHALKAAYPGHEVIALDIDPLGELGGGIHCATQQIPAA